MIPALAYALMFVAFVAVQIRTGPQTPRKSNGLRRA